MRIIFLDMDGVLNSNSFFKREDSNYRESYPVDDRRWEGYAGSDEWWLKMIDPASVKRLNRIIDRTNARVVISSSWRYHCDPTMMQRLLKIKGFKGEVIGRTPLNPELPKSFQHTGLRGTEIEVWLVKNIHLKVADYFVILDDIGPGNFGHLSKHLVRTTWEYGLLDEHIPKAVSMLQGG